MKCRFYFLFFFPAFFSAQDDFVFSQFLKYFVGDSLRQEVIPISRSSLNERKKYADVLKKNVDCVEPPDDSLTGLHLVDLNKDGFTDLVYNSWCDPYPRLQVFLSKKDTAWSKILNLAGNVLLDIIERDSSVCLVSVSKACCCLTTSSITISEVSRKSVSAVCTNFLWDAHTRFNTGKLQKCSESVLKNAAFLRYDPIVNDLRKKWECSDEFSYDGNICLALPKNQKVLILDSLVNAGNNWKFVLLCPQKKIKPSKNHWFAGAEPGNWYLGWVNSSALLNK